MAPKTKNDRKKQSRYYAPYVSAVVNCLSAVHNMAVTLNLPPELEVALIVEAHAVAVEMRDNDDLKKPFCDRVIAVALLRLNEQTAAKSLQT